MQIHGKQDIIQSKYVDDYAYKTFWATEQEYIGDLKLRLRVYSIIKRSIVGEKICRTRLSLIGAKIRFIQIII